MKEQGLEPMSFEQFKQQAVAGMSEGDDECWDIEATKSVYNKLLERSRYCYEEGLLSSRV